MPFPTSLHVLFLHAASVLGVWSADADFGLPLGTLLYGGFFSLAGFLCLFGAWHARYLPHRDARYGLIALLLTSALWAGAQLIFLLARTELVAYTAYTAGLVVGFSTVWAWLYFCSSYGGYTLHRHPVGIGLGAFVFSVVTLLKITNHQHGLYFSVESIPTPLAPFTISRHTVYWITTSVSYTLVLGGFLLLAARWAQVHGRTRALAGLFGLTLLPVIGNAVGFAVPALAGLYHEPLGVAAFALGVLFFARNAFVTVQEVGRRDEPTLVLGPNAALRAYNTSSTALFPNLGPEALGRPLTQIAPDVAEARAALRPIIDMQKNGSLQYYRITESRLHTGTDLVHLLTLSNITERERTFRAHEQLLHTITESVSDGLFQISFEDGLVYANRALASMLDYPSVEALHSLPATQLFASDGAHRLHEALHNDGTFTGELTCQRCNGTCFTGRVSATLVRNEQGAPAYINGVLVDLTIQKDREAELHAAMEKAEATARLKEYMLANMSHEIRTPLTAILGFSDMIRSETKGTNAEFAARIYQSGKRLERTLESVLTLSALQSGAHALRPTSVHLPTFLDELLGSFRAQAERNQITLQTASPPSNSDHRACIDPDGGRLIMRHLIDNAIKFTPAGGHVTAQAYRSGEQVHFVVKDDGIGIPPASQNLIFESFRQASEGQNRSHEGAGLGLAIVDACTALMGGSVTLKSTVGEGSRFAVQLPLADGSSASSKSTPGAAVSEDK
ncbi:hypothetical protein CRI93_08815 [Longimonas halophila]|uniref:histidine kinase n=1 Tax=Longimonas halophila TaxID=1469170 RepID=A0A2H3NL41_9BACT|nr:hypothetical protein CRI93_08815 [Longimonas halophila]